MKHILDNKWFVEENGYIDQVDIGYIKKKMTEYKQHIRKIYNNLPIGVKKNLVEPNGTDKIQFHDIMMPKIIIDKDVSVVGDYYAWQEQKEYKNKA